MSRDVLGEHPGIIPRPSSLGNFQASLETVLVTTLSSIFQSKNDTEIDFRFQRKVILKRQRRMNG